MKQLAAKFRIAIMFLKKTDKVRYSRLWFSIQNQFSREIDQRPKNMPSAYALLCTYNEEFMPPPRRISVTFPTSTATSHGWSSTRRNNVLQVQGKRTFYQQVPESRVGINCLQIRDTEDSRYELGLLQVTLNHEYNFAQIPDSWIFLSG